MITITFFELAGEVDRFFDASSLNNNSEPKAVILMGGVATGKTTVRVDKYSEGYVLIDSAQIFHNLSGYDSTLDFPDALIEPLEFVGTQVTRRALSERRNIVTEIVGADSEPTRQLIDRLEVVY